jgi:hypothetical protein
VAARPARLRPGRRRLRESLGTFLADRDGRRVSCWSKRRLLRRDHAQRGADGGDGEEAGRGGSPE